MVWFIAIFNEPEMVFVYLIMPIFIHRKKLLYKNKLLMRLKIERVAPVFKSNNFCPNKCCLLFAKTVDSYRLRFKTHQVSKFVKVSLQRRYKFQKYKLLDLDAEVS